MAIHPEEYIRSTSGLAQKIGEDLDAAREAYQDLWNTLNEKEKKQVLDEAIIDPAAVLKYSKYESGDPQETRSANTFSWFTRSQLNLFTDVSLKAPKTPLKRSEVAAPTNNNPPQDIVTAESKTKENNLLNKIKNKVTNLKIPTTVEDKQSLMEGKHQATVVKSVSKPKTPPPPPPGKQVLSERKALLSVDNESDDIPKTGFDFLDNW